MKHCEYQDCERVVRSRGLCASHWRQQHANEPLRPIKVYVRIPNLMDGMKVCTECMRLIPLTEYYRNSRGGRQSKCKVCTKAQQAVYRAQRRAKEVADNEER